MANLPSNFPHGASDEKILQGISDLGDDLLAAGGNLNSVMQISPLISIGQSELQAREARRTGRRLIALTWTLVGLTLVLVVLTIVLAVQN